LRDSGYKILIAEHQPIVIQGLQNLFDSNPGHKIIGVANNGSSIISLLNSHLDIDTLVISLNLERTNIYALIKELITRFPNLKIIVFTNHTMPKLVQSMMEYGVHAYLSKSASTMEILETITRVHEGAQIISTSVYDKPSSVGRIKNELIESKDHFTRFSELTKREIDIISLLSKGMTNKEMAVELNISIHTVETHRKNLMKKLNLRTSAQLVYLATLQGVV